MPSYLGRVASSCAFALSLAITLSPFGHVRASFALRGIVSRSPRLSLVFATRVSICVLRFALAPRSVVVVGSVVPRLSSPVL